MTQRGRKSAGDLTAVTKIHVRPKPLDKLTEAQCVIWNRIVERMPADWFMEESHDLLAQYCRHVVCSDEIAELINNLSEDEPIVLRDRLFKMQEREGRAISSLATRMRLSQQSTLDREKRKPKESPKPWKTL